MLLVRFCPTRLGSQWQRGQKKNKGRHNDFNARHDSFLSNGTVEIDM
jgi:hypothetical protein